MYKWCGPNPPKVADLLVNQLFANSSMQCSSRALNPGAMLTGIGYYDFERVLLTKILKWGYEIKALHSIHRNKCDIIF